MTERARKQLEAVRALGSPPKMWRYRQLRDWIARFNAIMAIDTGEMAEMLRSVYSTDVVERMADRANPFASMFRERSKP